MAGCCCDCDVPAFPASAEFPFPADFIESRWKRKKGPYVKVERVLSCRRNKGKVNKTLV